MVTLQEPPKNELIPFLEAEHAGRSDIPAPRREALVHINLNGLKDLREIHVDLDARTIIQETALEGRHSYQDSTEMRAMEKACLSAPEVQEAIRLLELPENAVVRVEPWTYGTDGMNDMSERIIMVCTFHSLFFDGF